MDIVERNLYGRKENKLNLQLYLNNVIQKMSRHAQQYQN